MLRRPSRRLLRWCAMLLLIWTAVDIAAPGLCALEREDEISSTVSADKADSVASTGASQPDESSTPVHVDDCFCCSHCVDLSRHAVMFAPSGDVARDPIDPVRLVDHVPPPPYHPPLG